MTYVEILVTMVIMSILAGTIMMGLTGYKERAERIGCSNNLRLLHVALTTYTHDVGHWPQRPKDSNGNNKFEKGHEIFGWLIGELAEYDAPRTAWICPTEKRLETQHIAEKEFIGSYVPTMFDRGPNTPWKWPKQPWLIERADNHGKGQLVILQDGSVHNANESFLH